MIDIFLITILKIKRRTNIGLFYINISLVFHFWICYSKLNFFKLLRCYNCTIFTIITIFIFCILICLPAYMYATVRENYLNDTSFNQTFKYYYVDQSDLNKRTNNLIFELMFYSQAFLGKLIPCIFLVIFTSLLICSNWIYMLCIYIYICD